MEQKLKHALSQRQKSHIVDASRIASAVLLPLYRKQREHHLLFTKRTDKVKDHKGQISFPGGAREECDESLQDTAIRECTEEIGLPAEAIEILGELDDACTVGTNYIISPFVAIISWPHTLKIDPTEVEEIIEVPISALLNKDCVHEGTDFLDGQVINAYFYHYQENVIWGATARILNQFLDIWAQVMKDNGG
ncbi:NUDIX hydrolase [Chloroflexota bacterium]